jgi:hypothetical protein
VEVNLAVAGAFLLALSWVVARRLRDRTRGIVARPEKIAAVEDLLEIGGTVAAAQRAGVEPPKPERDGGEFGGGGATGSY